MKYRIWQALVWLLLWKYLIYLYETISVLQSFHDYK
jgi:hypothetical protein